MLDLEKTPPVPVTAGFWRRALAFLVDAFVLGIVGLAIGTLLVDTLAHWGGWGRLLGFAIALAYLGVMNSRLGGGRTLGKRLLKIRAQHIDGTLLSLPRSLARASVLSIPFFLNGAEMSPEVLLGPAVHAVSLLVFGGILGILYLFVFNRKTRRSLHDYAARSWVVVDAAPRGPGAVPPLWRGHVAVVAVLCLASAAAPEVAKRLVQSEIASALPAHAAVVSTPGVEFAGVFVGWSRAQGVETTYTQVTARLSTPKVQDQAFAERLARAALRASPELADRQVMIVRLSYGFDIGIASGFRHWTTRFDPKAID